MAVLFPNITVLVDVRAHPAPRDDRGMPVGGAIAETRGPFPANAREQTDLTWTFRLDPRCAPLRADDIVREVGGTRVWVLTGNPLLKDVPGGPATVNYVAATAILDPPKVP